MRSLLACHPRNAHGLAAFQYELFVLFCARTLTSTKARLNWYNVSRDSRKETGMPKKVNSTVVSAPSASNMLKNVTGRAPFGTICFQKCFHKLKTQMIMRADHIESREVRKSYCCPAIGVTQRPMTWRLLNPSTVVAVRHSRKEHQQITQLFCSKAYHEMMTAMQCSGLSSRQSLFNSPSTRLQARRCN